MVICDYCGKPADLVSGIAVYPHRPDLADKKMYRCLRCDAYVGCHKGTDKPLGRLANFELRQAKMKAHWAFDPLWKSGQIRRGSAYGWLADQLGIERKDCHIGMFDVAMCQRVVEISRARANNINTQ